jgi:hypothetical protein
MDKVDIALLILAVVLVVGMLLTAFFGRGSRHGYGMTLPRIKTTSLVGYQ